MCSGFKLLSVLRSVYTSIVLAYVLPTNVWAPFALVISIIIINITEMNVEFVDLNLSYYDVAALLVQV